MSGNGIVMTQQEMNNARTQASLLMSTPERNAFMRVYERARTQNKMSQANALNAASNGHKGEEMKTYNATTNATTILRVANQYDGNENNENEAIKKAKFLKHATSYVNRGNNVQTAINTAHRDVEEGRGIQPPTNTTAVNARLNALNAPPEVRNSVLGMTSNGQNRLLDVYEKELKEGYTQKEALETAQTRVRVENNTANNSENAAHTATFIELLNGMTSRADQIKALHIFFGMRGELGHEKLMKQSARMKRKTLDMVEAVYKQVNPTIQRRNPNQNKRINRYADARTKNVLNAVTKQRAQNATINGARIQFRALQKNRENVFKAGFILAKLREVNGDGNCLFSSIVQALAHRSRGSFIENVNIINERQRKLRNRVADYQCSPIGRTILGPFMEDDQKLGGCAEIRKNGVFGGEPELVSLAMLLRTPIIIFTRARGGYVRHMAGMKKGVVYGEARFKAPPIYLVYRRGQDPSNPEGGAHYDYLYEPTVRSVIDHVAFVPHTPDMIHGNNTTLPPQPQFSTNTKVNRTWPGRGTGGGGSGFGSGFGSFSGIGDGWGDGLTGWSWILTALGCVASTFALASR